MSSTPLATLEATRDAIDVAIKAIVEGLCASKSINGRTYTLHNVGELHALRDKYNAEIAIASGSRQSMFRPVQFVEVL